VITDERGFPVPDVQVVILRGQKGLSRTYYPPGSFVEDQNQRPLCWSSDGIRPDETVAEPFSATCATCPNAAWGSGASPVAPKAQACQQRRRTVIVPYGPDLTNEDGGGPVLLSVPPGSLVNQQAYGQWLKDNSLKYVGCVTQLSFDPDKAFPKIEFGYIKPLTDDEVRVILGTRNNEQIERILNSKINVDGPEVMDGPVQESASAGGDSGAAPPKPAAPVHRQTQQRAPAQAAPASASAVNPPTDAAKAALARAAAAKANTQAAQAPKPAAPAPNPNPPSKRMGGFSVAGGTIADAVAKPATPPPSARAVNSAAAPTTAKPTPFTRKPAAQPAQPELPLEPEAEEASPEEAAAPESVMSRFEQLMSEK
jgi:hypothetical protein